MFNKKIVVDIDGVIATLVENIILVDDEFESLDYMSAEPIKYNIDFFNYLYDLGYEIVYFTARGSDTSVDWSNATEQQFKRWGVKYNELLFGKPSADYYIDDKFVAVEKLKKELNYVK
jgi:dTDP-glucose 4,6-dehydratase